MKVIYGDMEFGDFVVSGTPSQMCIIHKVQAIFDMNENEIEKVDDFLGQYDSYIIPSLSEHEIVYAPGAWGAITEKGEAQCSLFV